MATAEHLRWVRAAPGGVGLAALLRLRRLLWAAWFGPWMTAKAMAVKVSALAPRLATLKKVIPVF